MDIMHATVWFLTNVATPLLAPLALLPLAFLHRRYRGRIRMLVYRSVKDGQLLWTVIAMCAAAMYDAGHHLQDLLSSDSASKSDASVALAVIGWHSLVMLLSAVIVLLGALEALESDEAYEKGKKNLPIATPVGFNMILMVSVGLAIVTAITFSATHVWAD